MAPKRKTADVVFQGLEAGLRMFRWVVVILLVLFLVSGITKIEPDTAGLLLRFGALQGDSLGEPVRQPGLLLALPFPIDQVRRVPGKQKEGEVVIDEVWKELGLEVTTDAIDPVLEGYCITGDNNIWQAKIVVKYQVSDPVAFELWTNDKDREALLRDVVLASLVQTVAGWRIDDAIRIQRADSEDNSAPTEHLAELASPPADSEDNSAPTEHLAQLASPPAGPEGNSAPTEDLADLVRKRAQERLDALEARGPSRGCGMKITALLIPEKHPPRHVNPEFIRVQSAKIYMEEMKQQAEGDALRDKAKAESDANDIIQDATAHYETVTAQANAELSEFQQLYEEYRKSPASVWRRIYVETIETVFQNVKTHFVSPGAKVILQENGEKQP